ncbi:hypothetical protein ES703_15126 [subsurface metagenome]
MVNGKGKKIPPSRVRYEATHPIVSCRVSRDEYAQLDEIRTTQGKSLAAILLVGAGLLAPNKDEKALREKAFQEGFKEATRQVLREVEIGKCCVCGKPLLWDLTDAEHRRILSEVLRDHQHPTCR